MVKGQIMSEFCLDAFQSILQPLQVRVQQKLSAALSRCCLTSQNMPRPGITKLPIQ